MADRVYHYKHGWIPLTHEPGEKPAQRRRVAAAKAMVGKNGRVSVGDAHAGDVRNVGRKYHATYPDGTHHPELFPTKGEAVGQLVLHHEAVPPTATRPATKTPSGLQLPTGAPVERRAPAKRTRKRRPAITAPPPGGWKASDRVGLSAEHVHQLDLAGVCTGPGPCVSGPLSTSRTSNFVARGGGLPPYVRAIARTFMPPRGSLSESEAIQRAIGIVKNWASGQGNVSAATRARAAKAVAEWEALKAKAHSMSATDEGVDLAPKGQPPNQTTVDLAARTDLLRRAAVAHRAGRLSAKQQQMVKTYLNRIRNRTDMAATEQPVDLAGGHNWKHGYIPLTPAAVASKNHKGPPPGRHRVPVKAAPGRKHDRQASIDAIHVTKKERGYDLIHTQSGMGFGQVHKTKKDAEQARRVLASHFDFNQPADKIMADRQGVDRAAGKLRKIIQRQQQELDARDRAGKNHGVPASPAKVHDLVVVERPTSNFTTGPGGSKYTKGTDVHVGRVLRTDKNGNVLTYRNADGSVQAVRTHAGETVRTLPQSQVNVAAAIRAAKQNKWPSTGRPRPFDSLDAARAAIKPHVKKG